MNNVNKFMSVMVDGGGFVFLVLLLRVFSVDIIPFLRSKRIINNTKNLEKWTDQIISVLEDVTDLTGAEKKNKAEKFISDRLSANHIKFTDEQIHSTIENRLTELRASDKSYKAEDHDKLKAIGKIAENFITPVVAKEIYPDVVKTVTDSKDLPNLEDLKK